MTAWQHLAKNNEIIAQVSTLSQSLKQFTIMQTGKENKNTTSTTSISTIKIQRSIVIQEKKGIMYERCMKIQHVLYRNCKSQGRLLYECH